MKIGDCEMSAEEGAKLSFMRWMASRSREAWLPRRPAAACLWEAIVALVAAGEGWEP
jgi:hypothetical protein